MFIYSYMRQTCIYVCIHVKRAVMTYVISMFLIVRGRLGERNARMKCFLAWVAAPFYHFPYCFLFLIKLQTTRIDVLILMCS